MTPTHASSRLALVTGTSSGVGAATAERLVDRGWLVIGCARRPASLEHERYRHYQLDLGDAAALRQWGEHVLGPAFESAEFERVAVVNNAASIQRIGTAEHLEPDELAREHAVNLTAPMYLMALAGRRTPRRTPLRVVNVSSGAATHPMPGLAAYSAAKAGLRMAGMVFAAEWTSDVPHAPMRSDTAVLSYEPGVVDTAMQDHARGTTLEQMPWRGTFEHFAASGMLVPAEAPATEIVAFLERDGIAPFTEARLRTS